MPKYKFVYEPKAPVGNEFNKIWGQECPMSRNGLSCPACELRLYHYYTGTYLQTLHVWTGRVTIRNWATLSHSLEKRLNSLTVIFHSDYTLENLRSLSPSDSWYQEFVGSLEEEKIYG